MSAQENGIARTTKKQEKEIEALLNAIVIVKDQLCIWILYYVDFCNSGYVLFYITSHTTVLMLFMEGQRKTERKKLGVFSHKITFKSQK